MSVVASGMLIQCGKRKTNKKNKEVFLINLINLAKKLTASQEMCHEKESVYEV